jgi:hypothetical protein
MPGLISLGVFSFGGTMFQFEGTRFQRIRARPNGDVEFIYDSFTEIVPKEGPSITKLTGELNGIFDVPTRLLRDSYQSRADELFDYISTDG